MKDPTFNKEQQEVIAAYSRRLEKYGQSIRALNWSQNSSQERRFEILAEAGIQNGMSILDVGCGLGDFQQWALKRNLELQYSGLDITPGMVNSCKQRFPNNQFENGDIVNWRSSSENAYDFVIASGIFYDRPISAHKYMNAAVQSMYRLCRYGIAFNSITSLADQTKENEFRPTVGDLAEIAAQHTPYFVLRHDYHPCDATLYLYKHKEI